MAGQYMQGDVALWYKDEVQGPKRRLNAWSFKEVVFQLYRRFVTQTSTVRAAENYQKVQYDSSKGVLSYYNKLNRHTGRMAQHPDDYSFRSQLLSGLPPYIQKELIQGHQIEAKFCTVEAIVDAAITIEHGQASIERIEDYRKRQPTINNTKSNERPTSVRPVLNDRDRNGHTNMFRLEAR